MRINLKKDCEPPPPEFRKQGHHMLEIIAAQIKEMEDAGWVYRGYAVSDCRRPAWVEARRREDAPA